jgi:hypothetical protein
MCLTTRAICLCLFFAAGILFGQSDKGTITGTVSDPAGAMVPGAAVDAKNSETGALYQTASTATGNYTLGQLPAGTYQLNVSMQGFKQYTRHGITVRVAQTLRIDAALEVGALTESVTVNEDAPLLKTESGELSHTVTADRLDGLPVLGTGVTAAGRSLRHPQSVCRNAACSWHTLVAQQQRSRQWLSRNHSDPAD